MGKLNGHVSLRAVPANGEAIATDVASLLREKQIAVEELFVERGKLDDVFRDITASDQEGNHA